MKDTGDGFFVRFLSVSDAVIAALRFDDALRRMPAELCALKARVGIHVGEVIELPAEIGGAAKVVGLAVDIAARLAALARGGQILLSRLAFNEARQFVRAHPASDGEKSPVLKSAFGEETLRSYLKLKHDDWNAYARHLTDWERQTTLDC